MNLGDIKTIAKARLGWSDFNPLGTSGETTFTLMLNENVIEPLVRDSRFIITTGTISLSSGTKTYDFPTGMLFIQRIEINNDELSFMSLVNLAGANKDWRDDANATPEYWYIDKRPDTVGFHPTPNASLTATCWGVVLPTALSSASDETKLVKYFGDAALEGIIYYCMQSQGDPREEVQYAKWERAKQNVLKYSRKSPGTGQGVRIARMRAWLRDYPRST